MSTLLRRPASMAPAADAPLFDHRRTIFELMPCVPTTGLPEGEDWLYEISWRGQRALVEKQGRHAGLVSAEGASLDRDFPHLLRDFSRLACHDGRIDGMIVPANGDGRPSYVSLATGDAVVFVAFDLLTLDARDLRDLPLSIRRAALTKILPPANANRLCLSPEVTGAPVPLLEKARALGIGGLIAKQRYSPYAPGCAHGAWLRRPTELAGKFFVGGFVTGAHGIEEIMLGEWQGRQLVFAGTVHPGPSPAAQHTVARSLEMLRAQGSYECPFAEFAHAATFGENRSLDVCRWVQPKLGVEVAYLARGEKQTLRHPRMLGVV